MFSLVYRSRSSHVFKESQIQDMLEKARGFNSKNNITGCLLYYQGEFLQYLEGDKIKVFDLYDKIKVDTRHSQVELLSNGEIFDRVFENWEMAYEDFLGNNHQLQYLKILISAYMEDSSTMMNPNPTSNSFWRAAQKILQAKSIENS